MFPKVYQLLHAGAVQAIVGDRIARHGTIAQGEERPYIVWSIATGIPYDNLSDAPTADFTTVQIDCYSPSDRQVQELAEAVRALLDGELIVNRVVVNQKEPNTKLYRVSLDADFIDQR